MRERYAVYIENTKIDRGLTKAEAEEAHARHQCGDCLRYGTNKDCCYFVRSN